MSELASYKEEILEILSKDYPDFKKSRMSEFRRILGGADTTIYGFDLTSDSATIPLIMRLYRPAFSDSALKEFSVIQNLHTRGVGVPRPYLLNENSKSTGRAYIVMERIEGNLLSDELHASYSSSRFNQLLELFVRNLVAIHSVDWTEGLSFLDGYDIKGNPHLFYTYGVARPKRIIAEFGIDTLSSVIDWMDSNQEELHGPCLLHSDYHAMNNLVRDDGSIVTIDWGGVALGDRRYDLGFAAMALNSMYPDLTEKLVSMYQSLSGMRIQNLEYFMVLSGLWNLLRVYSCAFDFQITNESEESASLFLNDYRDYTINLVKTTQETTGVSMAKLLDIFE
ncbi:MAG: phosphotransferase [Candidatus Thorarchaeota archaeon]